MLPKIEVTGINTVSNPDLIKNYAIIAYGNVELPELRMSFRGVALCRVNHERWVAMAPKSKGYHPTEPGVVSWSWQGPFGQEVCDLMIQAYEKLNGSLPPIPTAAEVKAECAARRVRGAQVSAEDKHGLRRVLGARHDA